MYIYNLDCLEEKLSSTIKVAVGRNESPSDKWPFYLPPKYVEILPYTEMAHYLTSFLKLS